MNRDTLLSIMLIFLLSYCSEKPQEERNRSTVSDNYIDIELSPGIFLVGGGAMISELRSRKFDIESETRKSALPVVEMIRKSLITNDPVLALSVTQIEDLSSDRVTIDLIKKRTGVEPLRTLFEIADTVGAENLEWQISPISTYPVSYDVLVTDKNRKPEPYEPCCLYKLRLEQVAGDYRVTGTGIGNEELHNFDDPNRTI